MYNQTKQDRQRVYTQGRAVMSNHFTYVKFPINIIAQMSTVRKSLFLLFNHHAPKEVCGPGASQACHVQRRRNSSALASYVFLAQTHRRNKDG